MSNCLHCGCTSQMEVFLNGKPSTMEVPFANGYCPSCKYRCAKCKKLKGAIRRWMTVEESKICSCGLTDTLISVPLP